MIEIYFKKKMQKYSYKPKRNQTKLKMEGERKLQLKLLI